MLKKPIAPVWRAYYRRHIIRPVGSLRGLLRVSKQVLQRVSGNAE
jgi:hypothetical protein